VNCVANLYFQGFLLLLCNTRQKGGFGMRLLIKSCVVLLFTASVAFGQAPKAIITGPTQRDAGKSIIVKSTGSVGKDFHFKVFPPVPETLVLRDADTSELVLLFTAEKEGTYVVVLMAVQGDKGDMAGLTIQVGKGVPIPPTPTPTPTPVDDFTKTIASAYKTDLAAGVGTIAQKNTLASLYKTSAKTTVFDKTITKPNDIYNVLRKATADPMLGLPEGALPQTRQAIADYQKATLKLNNTVLLDDPTRNSIAAMFTRIGQVLDALTTTDE
jgi:hypothetical protein